jgi:splicing factor 3A subunit 3
MRLEQMVVAGKALTEFYDDGDGSARRTELDEMAGTEVFSTFYDKLKGIRDYYKQYPDQLPQQQDYDVKPKVQFSGSEVGGTFVDLFVLFERFINMPMFTRIDYLTFLNTFSDFAQVSRAQKFLPFHYPQYKSYLTDLRSYLIDFQQRPNPLAETKVLLDLVKTEFDAQWAEQAVAGWGAVEAVAATSSEQAADPLYCTDCCKQFSSTSTYTSHLSGRKHKKSMKTDSTKVDVTADPRAEELARLEFDVKAFADMLRPVVEATRVRPTSDSASPPAFPSTLLSIHSSFSFSHTRARTSSPRPCASGLCGEEADADV